MAYLDTSILGSFYCKETLSAAVSQALTTVSDALISPLVEVEFVSLLSLKVRTGDLDRHAASQTRQVFLKHKTQRLYRIANPDERVFAAAGRMLGLFNTSLRAMDALHLAIATAHKKPLWTTDKILANSAKTLGLPFKLITI